MKSNSTWIERDSNGRLYFVRERTRIPSAQQVLTFGLTTRPQHTSSSPKKGSARRREVLFNQPNHYYLDTSLPQSCPLITSARPTRQMYHQSHRSKNPVTIEQSLEKKLEDSTGDEERKEKSLRVSKPPIQHYAAPHPQMYPIPPHGPLNIVNPITSSQFIGYTPPFNPFLGLRQHPAQHVPLHNPHYPIFSPPTGISGVPPCTPIPPQTNMHICAECNRPRSRSYQMSHPIGLGEVPKRSICRRCRKEQSERDQTSYVNVRFTEIPRRRSQQRKQSTGKCAQSQERSRTRGCVETIDDDDDDDYHDRTGVNMSLRNRLRPISPQLRSDRYSSRTVRPSSLDVTKHHHIHPPLTRSEYEIVKCRDFGEDGYLTLAGLAIDSDSGEEQYCSYDFVPYRDRNTKGHSATQPMARNIRPQSSRMVFDVLGPDQVSYLPLFENPADNCHYELQTGGRPSRTPNNTFQAACQPFGGTGGHLNEDPYSTGASSEQILVDGDIERDMNQRRFMRRSLPNHRMSPEGWINTAENFEDNNLDMHYQPISRMSDNRGDRSRRGNHDTHRITRAGIGYTDSMGIREQAGVVGASHGKSREQSQSAVEKRQAQSSGRGLPCDFDWYDQNGVRVKIRQI